MGGFLYLKPPQDVYVVAFDLEVLDLLGAPDVVYSIPREWFSAVK